MKWSEVIAFFGDDGSHGLDDDDEVDGSHPGSIRSLGPVVWWRIVTLTENLKQVSGGGHLCPRGVPYMMLPIVSKREPPTGHLLTSSF